MADPPADEERVRIVIECPRLDVPVINAALVHGEYLFQRTGHTPAHHLISWITNEMIREITGGPEGLQGLDPTEAMQQIDEFGRWGLRAEDLGPRDLQERVDVIVEPVGDPTTGDDGVVYDQVGPCDYCGERRELTVTPSGQRVCRECRVDG